MDKLKKCTHFMVTETWHHNVNGLFTYLWWKKITLNKQQCPEDSGRLSLARCLAALPRPVWTRYYLGRLSRQISGGSLVASNFFHFLTLENKVFWCTFSALDFFIFSWLDKIWCQGSADFIFLGFWSDTSFNYETLNGEVCSVPNHIFVQLSCRNLSSKIRRN